MKELEQDLELEQSIENVLEKAITWIPETEIKTLDKIQVFTLIQAQFELVLQGAINRRIYLDRMGQLLDVYRYVNR